MSKKPMHQQAPNGATFYGDPLPFPISRVVRAGDFVITSAFGAHVPDLASQTYDDRGMPILSDARKKISFADEVHGTFKSVQEALALAGCTLSDVVDSQVWLKDPRDFQEMNLIYETYFKEVRPIRMVFQNHFMMEFRIEIKVVAYRPLEPTPVL